MLTTPIIGLLVGIVVVSVVGIASAYAGARPKRRTMRVPGEFVQVSDNRAGNSSASQDNPAMKMAAEGNTRTQPSFPSTGR